ncbi:MAG: rod shape-determining protein MreD [Acidobacteriales bacterium]|nr:rod shape-determining protein MreD [Terriglobales bacterium]
MSSTGLSYTSREEIEVYRFRPLFIIVVSLAAIFLQAFLPVRLNFLRIFDLPLLVTIFFAVARRNPVSGLLTGCFIGLVQDALTAKMIGLYGIAKTIVGYAASSLGVKIDVENPGSRLILTFVFYLLHRVVYLMVQSGLVQEEVSGQWLHHLGAAFANGLLAIVLFAVLDRFKQRA